jgi:hypothetical protein
MTDPRVMLGIYHYPGDVPAFLSSWQALVGKGVAWLCVGSALGEDGGGDGWGEISTYAPLVFSGVIKGVMYTFMTGITPDEWDAGGVGTAAVVNGDYDAYITTQAILCRNASIPIILRIDQEMNSNYAGYGDSPTDFVAAWQRIHGIFKTNNADNVKFFWCPNYTDTNGDNVFSDYYPGTDYVDYVGTDMYTANEAVTGWWTAARQIKNTGFNNVYDTYTTKSFIIGEWGCSNSYTDAENQTWLNDMFSSIATDTRVVGMMHWHRDIDGWPVDNHALTFAAYKTALENSLFTNTLLGWIWASTSSRHSRVRRRKQTQQPQITTVPVIEASIEFPKLSIGELLKQSQELYPIAKYAAEKKLNVST